jgi:ParB/RepB/Spo0J family partition protein
MPAKPRHSRVDVTNFSFPSENSVALSVQSPTDERDQAQENELKTPSDVQVPNLDSLSITVTGEEVPPDFSVRTEGSAHSQRIQISIDDIMDSHYQTREKRSGPGTEKFQRLVKSMRKNPPDVPIKVHPHPTIPGKWQISAGGHNRVAAAKVAGFTSYPVIIVDYNDEDAALGTAWENLAREDLSPLEEGDLYLKIRKSRGYNRDELAEELGVSPDRIKECEALAHSAEDIKEMIRRIKALGNGNDTDRGLQAAKQLRRLDILDQRREGLATHIRAPLIDAFVYERITTSEVGLAATKLLGAEDPEAQLAAILRSLHQKDEMEEDEAQPSERNTRQVEKKYAKEPSLQRETKLSLLTRNFKVFTQLLGDTPPSEEEKLVLNDLRRQIDTIMSR